MKLLDDIREATDAYLLDFVLSGKEDSNLLVKAYGYIMTAKAPDVWVVLDLDQKQIVDDCGTIVAIAMRTAQPFAEGAS